MVLDVMFQLMPFAGFVPDLFAMRASRQKAAQGLDLGQRLLKFADQYFLFAFDLFAVLDLLLGLGEFQAQLAGNIFQGAQTESNFAPIC